MHDLQTLLLPDPLVLASSKESLVVGLDGGLMGVGAVSFLEQLLWTQILDL